MPRAQVFTVCVGSDDFGEDVGDDAAYMLGVSPWDKSLDMTDSVTGWTAREFYDNFESFSGESATYHAASAAASLNVAVLAMEASTCLALWSCPCCDIMSTCRKYPFLIFFPVL